MKFATEKQHYRYCMKINAGKQHNIFTTGPRNIVSNINVSTKGVYLPISKLHSILSDANLRVHNNTNQICYCGQISFNIYFAGDGTCCNLSAS